MVLRGWGARVCALRKSRTRAREPGGGQPPRPLIARPSPLPPTPVPRSTPFDPAAAHLPRALVPYLPAGGVVAVAVVASTCCPSRDRVSPAASQLRLLDRGRRPPATLPPPRVRSMPFNSAAARNCCPFEPPSGSLCGCGCSQDRGRRRTGRAGPHGGRLFEVSLPPCLNSQGNGPTPPRDLLHARWPV